VLFDDSRAPLSALQQLTHLLCSMYPNALKTVALPSPLMHAMKRADFAARVDSCEDPHESLRDKPFYL
jgi:ribosomal 50S subunit-associated protein YjgA (DUF615 family)